MTGATIDGGYFRLCSVTFLPWQRGVFKRYGQIGLFWAVSSPMLCVILCVMCPHQYPAKAKYKQIDACDGKGELYVICEKKSQPADEAADRKYNKPYYGCQSREMMSRQHADHQYQCDNNQRGFTHGLVSVLLRTLWERNARRPSDSKRATRQHGCESVQCARCLCQWPAPSMAHREEKRPLSVSHD